MLSRWHSLARAAIAGALAVPAFGLPDAWLSPVPGGLTFLPWLLPLLPIVSLACLVRQLDREDLNARSAARTGYAWGMGFFLAGVSWIYVSLSQFSGLPAPVAALATVALCAYLALYPALACGLFARLRPASRPAGGKALTFAALWAVSEWLRGTLFTGFPWLAIGYAQMPPSPLAGYASVAGVYGVSFASALLAALLVQRNGRRLTAMAAITALVGIGALLAAMVWTTPTGPALTVNLLQGNVPQSVKWEPGQLERSVATYQALVDKATQVAAPGEMINILPETAIPLLYDQIPAAILARLSERAPVLMGVAVRTADDGYANTAIALTKAHAHVDQPAGIYAKAHLVPFGEFSPPGFAWFFKWMRIPMADFSPGPPRQAPIALGGQQFAPNICYEDVFGEELLPSLAQATLLVNLSNTAWFGDSLAQPQHLQIARMRALETGRTMLRATNSGMTAMILPNGEVAAKLAAFTTGVLRVEAQGYTGRTPYAKWGNALTLTIAAATIILAWRRRRRAD